MSTPSRTPYDLFISYARKDNRQSWVQGLCRHIQRDHARFSTRRLNIFLDTSEIRDLHDWRHRILGALRSSKILLVCLSPDYFASGPCQWEFEEYVRRQVHQLIGSDSIAQVYFVTVEGGGRDDQCMASEWHAQLRRHNYTDVRPWFDAGPKALRKADVRRRMDALGTSLWERLQRARRAESAPGNLRWQNPHFLGRTTELRRLHESLGLGRIGVVTAVQGLGGMGKTELAVAYAHGFADSYPAGLWSLGAEGKTELLPLLGELAWDRDLGFTPTEAEKADPVLLGRGVLAHLKQRVLAVAEPDPDRGAACLILLDNVSDPALLSAAQLATLPGGLSACWLAIVATTRLDIPEQKDRLCRIAIDALDESTALALIRDHQPIRDARGWIVSDPRKGNPAFANSADEAAALEIVRALGGFTLAVEHVALYLGLHPDLSPVAFFAWLQEKGLSEADTLVSREEGAIAGQMHTQSKQLGLILEATLSRLDAPTRTALLFAALLPPDLVPWPWLRALSERIHPEIATSDDIGAGRWLPIQRRLTGLRLLTPGDEVQIARMHRLVAAHLRRSLPERDLKDYVRHLANEISITPSSWPENRTEALLLLSCVGHLAETGAAMQAVDFLRGRLLHQNNRFRGTKQFALLPEIIEVCDTILKDPGLSVEASAFLLQQRGYCARALGRSGVALASFGEALRLFEADSGSLRDQHEDKSTLAALLATTHLYVGNLQEAELYARKAVTWAGLSNNEAKRMYTLCTLGKVLMQLGKREEAGENLAAAADIIVQLDSGHHEGLRTVITEPGNVSNAQFRYGEFLIEEGEFSQALELAENGIQRLSAHFPASVREPMSLGLLELVKARALLMEKSSLPAHGPLDSIIGGALRNLQAGKLDTETVRGHLLKAEFHALQPNLPLAISELDLAMDMASRGDFRLHLVDILLLRLRFFHDHQPYPWESAAADFRMAGQLIQTCGYLRRHAVLEQCRTLLGEIPDAP